MRWDEFAMIVRVIHIPQCRMRGFCSILQAYELLEEESRPRELAQRQCYLIEP